MLCVWLPLNGDLHNQGLINYNISMLRGSAIFDNNGKIGKCFYANGVNTIKIENIISDFYNYTGYSLCVWFYIESQNTSHSGSGIISAGNWNSQVLNLALSDWSTDHYTQLRVSGTNWDKKYSYTFNKNTWYHVVISSDGSKTYAYVNGILIGETQPGFLPTSIEGSNIAIGGATYYGGMQFFGKINDVRIYDHCLNAKEVEEIAKGLVLHYKLDDRFCESTTNLCTSGTLGNSAYNGATNKYSYGTTTDMYKTTGIFQGRQATKVYMGTAGKSAYPYVWFDNIHPSQNQYKTLSFDYYPTSQTTLIFYTYNGSGTTTYSVNNGSVISGASIPVKLNQWNHIVFTILGTSNKTNGWGYVRIGAASHTSTTTDYWLFANIQIENKDHATGYAGPGGSRTATTIYDSSGYNNNGTVVGSLTATTPSPRYNLATNFNTTSSKIKTNTLNVTGFTNSYTISWWDKTSNYSGKMSWGFSDGNRLNGIYNGNLYNTGDGSSNPLYIPGTTTQVSTSSANTWHHFCYVGNGTTAKVYRDGELWAQAKTYKSLNGTTIYLNGWSNGTDYSTADLQLSDFRIYATALTAEQVADLYHTSMTIDNQGNVHARELVEL